MLIQPEIIKKKFLKVIEHVKNELKSLRTGRASVSILDDIKVEAYDGMYKIQEVANIQVKDANLLVVSPWDQEVIQNIETAIKNSGLSLNPVVDGEIIRIPIPALTQERRQEMVKKLHQIIEQGKVMLRSVRSEEKKEIEELEGESGVSEDDIQLSIEKLDDLIHEYSEKLEKIGQDKEQDLLNI